MDPSTFEVGKLIAALGAPGILGLGCILLWRENATKDAEIARLNEERLKDHKEHLAIYMKSPHDSRGGG